MDVALLDMVIVVFSVYSVQVVKWQGCFLKISTSDNPIQSRDINYAKYQKRMSST